MLCHCGIYTTLDTLHTTQEESLRAKPSLLVVADELERLAVAIKPALDEQLAAAEQQAVQAAQAAQAAKAAVEAKDAGTQAATRKSGFQQDDVHKLVGLLYLAQVFGGTVADVPTEVTAAVKSLEGAVSQQQLGALANLGAALTSPEGEFASHKVPA